MKARPHDSGTVKAYDNKINKKLNYKIHIYTQLNYELRISISIRRKEWIASTHNQKVEIALILLFKLYKPNLYVTIEETLFVLKAGNMVFM